MSKTYLIDNAGNVVAVIDHGEGDPPRPDYKGFYAALLSSAIYQAVLQMPATAELARALAIFVSAIQDAMAGRVNEQAMQGAIWLLLSQVQLGEDNVTELTVLMNTYHLGNTYSLAPP